MMIVSLLLLRAASVGARWPRGPGGVARGGGAFADGEGTYLQSFPAAFTPEECARIEELFLRREVEVDERIGEGVSRVNRWVKSPLPGEFDWILRRVLEHLPPSNAFWGFSKTFADADVKTFEQHVDFALMHEFGAGRFFDWHVDTKPDDETDRTLNVNVVLSKPGDFQGGDLQVANTNASLGIGDLHAYPAACPHKVHDISRGRRRTLVLAVRAAPRGAAPSQSSAYWASARRRYELLCADGAPPKLHWIFGQYLEASGDGPAAVQKFGDSYRASAERDQYVAAFASEAESLHAADDLEGAAKALEICAAIEPHVASHLADLGVVRWKLGALDAAEAALRRAIFNQGAVEAQAALRAALSLVLADLGRGAEAAEEERLARQGHPETAAAALEHLATLRR
ncbi:hypothetical protein M885DRAFT_518793 [Pelagophyceae sp. CCMP2097]|nr:hypothetical protein M885DRAFT_518793 [Pelagophyceae sp. CCMP2097]